MRALGDLSLADMRERTGVPESTLHDRLRPLDIGKAWEWVDRISEDLGIPIEPHVPPSEFSLVDAVLVNSATTEAVRRLVSADQDRLEMAATTLALSDLRFDLIRRLTAALESEEDEADAAALVRLIERKKNN